MTLSIYFGRVHPNKHAFTAKAVWADLVHAECDLPLDPLRSVSVERCLLGDLHLVSPESARVGQLASVVKRFDLVAMKSGEKGLQEALVLTSLNLETFVCKVVSERESFKDPIDKEPSRLGHVTLSNLRFLRRPMDLEIVKLLKSEDFFPPEVGDLHQLRGKAVPVKEVWEDEMTGRIHWTYGEAALDEKAASTCCTRKGRLVAPFRALPTAAVREMVEEETKKDAIVKRVSPGGWCDIPSLWKALDAGHNTLEVACVSAIVKEMVAQTGKRRGGPRTALVVDATKVPLKRPRVKVKCTDYAFKCRAGSRFGLLKQNALGKDYIDSCGRVIAFSDRTCKYRVKIDNCDEELDMDAHMGKAVQLPQLDYKGGTGLTILQDGRLINAIVSHKVKWNTFALRFDKGEEQLVHLNEANHAEGHLAELDAETYRKYCTTQRDRFRYLEDSITCQKMDVETQVIWIDTTVENATCSTPDIKSLASLLLDADCERFKGQQLIFRCLMIAGSGTGKTWSACQLMYHLSKACAGNFDTTGIVKMPVLIFAQKLAGMMRQEGLSDVKYANLPLSAQNAILDQPWLENAFKIEYGNQYGDVLLRALRLRSAVVILDGIDEASDVKGVLQSYIIRRLVPMQISMVLTSRPEGVNAVLGTLKQSFAIMSLKPPSDEQQRQIILNQVQSEGNLFMEKLMKFAEIRANHDKIYFTKAFPDPKDRRYMEKQLPTTDRFKRKERPGEPFSWDPAMVQHTLEGKVAEATAIGKEPTSEYLKAASAYFTEDLFSLMDVMLAEGKPTAELERVVQEKFPETEAFDYGPSLARKLYKLAEKRKVQKHQELWSKVVSGTDQLLTVAEYFKPIFEKTIKEVCQEVQEELIKDVAGRECNESGVSEEMTLPAELLCGRLKDPVRITEKAADDYADRFPNFIPEVNVIDVVRARLVCNSLTQMKAFMRKFEKGYQTEIDGQKIKLTLARVKNKFSGKDIDPTRFRHVSLNLQLHSNENFHIVELQFHYKMIVEYNDASHAHDLYNFFRAELADQYDQAMEASLNFMMESRMQLFKEISEVPVLLSVMTMALMHSNQMPSSLFELYDMGLRNILESQLGRLDKNFQDQVWQLMQLVALHNQLNQKRIFSQKDVETALAKKPEFFPIWAKFVEQGDVPFVKILADGEDAEYQFRHLSFQEALAAQVLAADSDPIGIEAAERFKQIGGSLVDFLNMPFYRNMLQIGAGFVGDVFGQYWPLTSQLTDDGRAGLWNLLLGARKLILVSFLRPQVESHKAYEKAIFPERSEDWFRTMFLFKSTIEFKGGSVMYSLRKLKSQVQNLEAALVSNAACHLLFGGPNGLDLSAFEVNSETFPVQWNGNGQALDVAKAPGRIGWQLHMNSKASLVHFQESEMDSLDPPRPKMEIADRVPELHSTSGIRWIFVSALPQEAFSFNPSLCTKVIPVYIRNSGAKPEKRGKVIEPAATAELQMASTYQRSYGLHTSLVPSVSKETNRSDEVLADEGSAATAFFSGGSVLRHYGRVDKVAWAPSRKQCMAVHFVSLRAVFQSWKMARGIDPATKAAVNPALSASQASQASPKDGGRKVAAQEVVRGAVNAKEEEQIRREMAEVKFCSDAGGNAAKFQGGNAEEALLRLKTLWSKAWKEQGHRLSDFQRFLTEMSLPVLGQSRLRDLRPWLRNGGPRWDFRLDSWPMVETAVISAATDPTSERINEKVVNKWISTLRGSKAQYVAGLWDSEFISHSWKQIPKRVIWDDLISQHQVGYRTRRRKGYLNLRANCMAKAEAEYSASAATVDSERINEKVVNQWISTLRGYEAPYVAGDDLISRQGKHFFGLPPGHRKWSNEGQVVCDGCANTPDVYFEGYERWKKGRRKPEALKLCEVCYKKRRRKVYLNLRSTWDPETTPQKWPLLPRDAVLLDHSTRMQLRIAQRRQKSGQTWQQCFKALCQRLPSVSFNVEFFTHRMDSDTWAPFATAHGERFIAKISPAEEPSRLVLMRDEAFPRCLVAHRRRCKKRLQENPKSGLTGAMPSAFFTHRLSDGRATTFRQKFARILSMPNDGTKDRDDHGDRGDRGPEMTPEPDS
eukprot:s223_g56.t1